MNKFEIPDKLLEEAGLDMKNLSPNQLKAIFAQLAEKGSLNDKPGDKKSTGKESGTKKPEDAQGSRPGLVKKKVTVRRNGKTSEEYRWVKSGEDEPTEKPKKGDEATGEGAGEVPGKLPEKPKGPAIKGLNKPDGEDDEPEDIKGKEFMDWQSGDEIPGGVKVGSKVDIGKFGVHTVKDITGGVIIGEDDKPYAITSIEEVLDVEGKPGEVEGPKKVEESKRTEELKYVQMTKNNVKDMKDFFDAGLPDSTHSMNLHLVEFKGGEKAIYKVSEELNDIVGETGFYNLSQALEWNICPQTVETDLGHGTGTSQLFVSGDSPRYNDEGDERAAVGVTVEEKHFDDIAKIFVMDTIVGNPDRHFQNIMLNDDGKCWAIDNDTWVENAYIFPNEDKVTEIFDNLQFKADKTTGTPHYDAITDWLRHSLDADGFKKFKKVVDKNLESMLKYKDDIESYYESPGAIDRKGAIANNINLAEKYLSEQKK